MAHVSYTTIKKIRQKLNGEVDEVNDGPKNKTLSLPSRAFKLFLEEGNTIKFYSCMVLLRSFHTGIGGC